MVVWLPWHNYFWINTAPLIHPFNASRSSCLWRKAALIYRYENAMVRSETRLSSLNQMHILPMTILMRRQTIQVANIHPLSRPLGQALKSPFNAQAHCCGEIHNKNNTWQALFGSQFEDPAHHSREVMTAEAYGSRSQSMLSGKREGWPVLLLMQSKDPNHGMVLSTFGGGGGISDLS